MDKYNLFISPAGNLLTRHTGNPEIDRMLDYVRGQPPLALTTVPSDRRVLAALYENRIINLEPASRTVIYKVLNESRKAPPPILPPTDYELAGWIDTFGKLKARNKQPECPKNHTGYWPKFAPGLKCQFRYFRLNYTNEYTRPQMHYSEESQETYVKDHEIVLTGKDSGYRVQDSTGHVFFFRDNPRGGHELPTESVWKFFERPRVATIAHTNKKMYQDALQLISDMEELTGADCYPGQGPYIAALACAKSGLCAAETGTGKSFMAIFLDLIHNPTRTLVIAPKGTVKDDNGNEMNYEPAQWVEEFRKFSPGREVFPLFSMDDYRIIMRDHGRLPPGVYITYPQAFFTGGGAFECIPKSWPVNDLRLKEEKFRKRFGYKWNDLAPPVRADYIHEGIGDTRNGITCIYKSSMATDLGHLFDMILLDEAHLICNPDSMVTRNMIKLQPKHRYALTATPIPNKVFNIFPLCGWVSTEKWYRGDVETPQWPYSNTPRGRASFKDQFTTKERDLTAENMRGTSSTKEAAVISQPQKLLKLLKPIMAFISKEDCNPALVDCNVNTVRVPFGKQQMKLYAHNLQVANIPHSNPKTRYGVQMMRLRGICADPKGREYNDVVSSNMNPKYVAILEAVAECLAKDEQVIVVSAFQGMSEELGSRLMDANVPYSRIDGTTSDSHVSESNAFKRGDTKVMLMGIKCAQAHSFSSCRNLIIGSVEWSYGSFNQAMGRVYRLNSPQDVNIWVILHKDSIEEMMFDKLATKRDAATICLHGKPLPREFRSVKASEVFAEHFCSFDESAECQDEADTEENWWLLRDKLEETVKKYKLQEVA